MRIPLLSQPKPRQDDAGNMAKLPGPIKGNAGARGVGAAVLAAILGTWGTTQLGAKMAEFSPSLPGHFQGRLWFPWAIFDGWGSYFSGGDYFLLMTVETVALAISLGFGVAVWSIMESKAKARHDKKKLDIHGSSAWATFQEVQAANMIGHGEGVYLASLMNPDDGSLHPIQHNGPEHILVSAPTRSGKGVAIIIPTLFTWSQSAVIYDMKGELWALTAAIRKSMGHEVLQWNPSSRDSVHFNPLDEIDIFNDTGVADVQNVALMLVDNDGAGLDDHWKQKAYEVITAAIIYALLPKSANPPGHIPSLGEVADLLTDVQDDQAAKKKEILKKFITCKAAIDPAYRDHPAIKGAAHFCSHIGAQLHEIEDRELSSIFSTTVSRLTLFFDPIVRANCADSHFRLVDLMREKAAYQDGQVPPPVSLYMTVPQKEKDRLKPLIRLMFTMIVRNLAQNLEFSSGKGVNPYVYRLLLVLDEFPSLGRLSIVEEALAYMAGYGMKALIVIQDRQQVIKAYTVHEALTAGCHIRVAFAPNTLETAKWLSDMAGQTTVYHRTESISGKKTNIYGLEHLNQADQYYSRPLITPDEVMRIPSPKKERLPNGEEQITAPGAELILVSGQKPVFARQELYFLHPWYVDQIHTLPRPPAFDPSIWKVRTRMLPKQAAPEAQDDDLETSNVMTDYAGFLAVINDAMRFLPAGSGYSHKGEKRVKKPKERKPETTAPVQETAPVDTPATVVDQKRTLEQRTAQFLVDQEAAEKGQKDLPFEESIAEKMGKSFRLWEGSHA